MLEWPLSLSEERGERRGTGEGEGEGEKGKEGGEGEVGEESTEMRQYTGQKEETQKGKGQKGRERTTTHERRYVAANDWRRLIQMSSYREIPSVHTMPNRYM